ncbi:tripartite tricarboxylate transporter substrate binding protein, partial [Mycobacterium tuberculosis]
RRSALLPEVPTFAESGYAEVDMDSWLMLAAPKGVPADVKARLEKALAATIADPETKARLLAAGLEPSYSNAAASVELINRELPIMRAVAARA